MFAGCYSFGSLQRIPRRSIGQVGLWRDQDPPVRPEKRFERQDRGRVRTLHADQFLRIGIPESIVWIHDLLRQRTRASGRQKNSQYKDLIFHIESIIVYVKQSVIIIIVQASYTR